MNNEEYAESIGAKKGTPEFNRCIERLTSYGDNKWWLSDDPKERAYYQALEPVQVIDWNQYRRDLKVLLGRIPLPYEMVLDEFEQEVRRAWKYNVGCTSEQEAEGRLKANMEKLLVRKIQQASPEELQQAIHLAGKLCPCPRCADTRGKAEKRTAKKRRR